MNAGLAGNAQAIKDLAFYLYNGINVSKDKALAYDLYTMAADMGNLQAKVDLTYIGYHGLDDVVESDKDQAIDTMAGYVDASPLAAELHAAWTGVNLPSAYSAADVVAPTVYPVQETVEYAVEPRNDIGCGYDYATNKSTICFYPNGTAPTTQEVPTTVTHTYNIVAECDYLGVDSATNKVNFGNCSFEEASAPQHAYAGETLKVNNLPEEQFTQEDQYFELNDNSNSVRLDDFFRATVAPNVTARIRGARP